MSTKYSSARFSTIALAAILLMLTSSINVQGQTTQQTNMQPNQQTNMQPNQQTNMQPNQQTNMQPNQQTNMQPNRQPNMQQNQQPNMQQNQQTNQQAPCSSKFEAAVAPECFTATGVNFTGVLYIISGNMSGAIPSGHTFSSFLELVCSPTSQDKIIPCVLANMNKHNTTQCSPQDRNLLYGRGGQLLAFMEAICGQPCEQVATQSLIQCFSVTSTHPERFLRQNASITDDRYSIIGQNETEVDSFCKNRQKLFSCLSPLPSTCPGLLKRMYAIGIDLQAMETATGFLCNDKQKYLKSLECFSKPSQEISQCAQNTTSSTRAAFTARYQTGSIPPSKYQDSLCKTKISQIMCELAAYGKSCDADVMPLRASVECTMLPKPCKEDSQAAYNSVCDKVTTPSPAETFRPTQGKPGAIPVDGGSSNFQSVRSGTNAADIMGFSVATSLLLMSGFILTIV